MRIATRALIFNAAKKLLTVQHHGSDFWALPGGKIEKNENLKECLQREIFEELGLKCEVKNLACVQEFQWSAESDITLEFFFYAIIEDENIENFTGTFAEQELKKISWKTLDKNLDIKPEFLKTIDIDELENKTQYFSYV